MSSSNPTSLWPPLAYADWKDTQDTLHLWSQIVGKIRLVQTPWVNHSWHVALYLTTRGLTTSPIPYGSRTFEIEFDFLSHQLRIATLEGKVERMQLAPRSVADFYQELFARLKTLGLDISMRALASLEPKTVRAIGNAYRQRLESLLAVDEGVARFIGALRDGGVLENTLVIFTSDNGYFQGEHRVRAGKTLPYEPAVKVPLLIRGAGIAPGRQVSAMVANIDLAPTIVEAAGVTAGRSMDGSSLWPFLSGGQTTWPNGQRHVLVEDSPRGNKPTVFWSIKRESYVYTEYANGNRELYDLAIDSAQVASRHADPGYARVRQELAKRLTTMKTCVGPAACW